MAATETESRWNEENLQAGWDAGDVKAELDCFFDEVPPDELNKETVSRELQQTMGLYERGIQSGKVNDPNEFGSDERARLEKIYGLALESSKGKLIR